MPLSLTKPVNLLRGVVPTTDFFGGTGGQVPTNLANATDGDPTTSTGEGIGVTTGATTVGIFIFDRGAANTNNPITIHTKIGAWVSTSSMDIYIASSTDGTNFYNSIQLTGPNHITNTTEQIATVLPADVYTRYFRIILVANGALTGHAKLYTVNGYPV